MKVLTQRHIENDRDVFPNQYFGTLSELKAGCRAADKKLRVDLVAEELDVQTDKAGVVSLLNGNVIATTARAWNLTARGALEEA